MVKVWDISISTRWTYTPGLMWMARYISQLFTNAQDSDNQNLALTYNVVQAFQKTLGPLASFAAFPFGAPPVDVAPPLTTHGAELVIGSGSPLKPAMMNAAESL
jgi:hypothetical protein